MWRQIKGFLSFICMAIIEKIVDFPIWIKFIIVIIIIALTLILIL